MRLTFNARRTSLVTLMLVCAVASLLSFGHKPSRTTLATQDASAAAPRPDDATAAGVRGGSEGPVSLRGEEALEQLKREGAYESLAGAMTAARWYCCEK